MKIRTFGVVLLFLVVALEPVRGRLQDEPMQSPPSKPPAQPGVPTRPKLPPPPPPCGPKGSCPDSQTTSVGHSTSAPEVTLDGCLDFDGTVPLLVTSSTDGKPSATYKLQLPPKMDISGMQGSEIRATGKIGAAAASDKTSGAKPNLPLKSLVVSGAPLVIKKCASRQ